MTEQSLERYYVAELLRLRGHLLQQRGDLDAAESSFRDALAFAERQGVMSLSLRAAMGLAGMLAARGDTADARVVLAPVLARFTEGFGTADLMTQTASWSR